MLPTTITRVTATQRAGAAVLSNSPSHVSPAAALTSQCLAHRRRRSHQRRQSSSKAAPPADSDNPTPATKAPSSASATTTASSTTQVSAGTEPRARGKKTSRQHRFLSPSSDRSKTNEPDRFAGLPAVPGIQHLHEKDFGLCSFFSLHRPLSLNAAIPPSATPEQFHSIFESKATRESWENGNSAERRPEDVIYTLHNTIDALESSVNDTQDEGVRWEVVQESTDGGNVKHLDGAPRMKSLRELVDQFRPFHAPPPPEAFSTAGNTLEKKKTSRAPKSSQAPRQKRYTATIMVTESTDAQGQRTFTASSSPIVRVPDVEEQNEPASIQAPGVQRRVRQPFLERMRRRGQIYTQAQRDKALAKSGPRPAVHRMPGSRRIKMFLISVKRQRKLKMKKHKYKKLMKRTRNLRRRLDRA